MASSWGRSWGRSWGNSWGRIGLQLKYWNGSSWVQKPLKYWTGSTWSSAGSLKRFDGTNWV